MVAWIRQTFEVGNVRVVLDVGDVRVEDATVLEGVSLVPRTRSEANQMSMMFRKASVRLGEIAKGLPLDGRVG